MSFNNRQFESSPPNPSAMLHSLRAFGYTLEMAIADIIDNSITADATIIKISFKVEKYASFIRIEDNGKGMTLVELQRAMQLGSKNPLNDRENNDLGRFGLGLKTASFSQCKRFTVKTKQSDFYTRAWDLDHIHQSNSWLLSNKPFDVSSENNLGDFSYEKGTIVLWEKLDRLIETGIYEKDKENFYRKFEKVKIHLGLVFHRFLEENLLKIYVGEEEIKPFNPFYISDKIPSTELSTEQYSIGENQIFIHPYILPHESKLSESEIKKLNILKGWNEHQGIFLYRNKRLILDGTWLDLPFRKKENQRLLRIQVDIPNTLDKQFQIDVKKSLAKVPDDLRDAFNRICKYAIDKATKVYSHRGSYVKRKNENNEMVYVWKTRQIKGKKSYFINHEHPLFKIIYTAMDDSEKKMFKGFIKIIEESLPVGMIVNDFSDNQMLVESSLSKDKITLNAIFQNALIALINGGMEEENAKNELLKSELFHLIAN